MFPFPLQDLKHFPKKHSTDPKKISSQSTSKKKKSTLGSYPARVRPSSSANMPTYSAMKWTCCQCQRRAYNTQHFTMEKPPTCRAAVKLPCAHERCDDCTTKKGLWACCQCNRRINKALNPTCSAMVKPKVAELCGHLWCADCTPSAPDVGTERGDLLREITNFRKATENKALRQFAQPVVQSRRVRPDGRHPLPDCRPPLKAAPAIPSCPRTELLPPCPAGAPLPDMAEPRPRGLPTYPACFPFGPPCMWICCHCQSGGSPWTVCLKCGHGWCADQCFPRRNHE